jgi:hypothetical protein
MIGKRLACVREVVPDGANYVAGLLMLVGSPGTIAADAGWFSALRRRSRPFQSSGSWFDELAINTPGFDVLLWRQLVTA